MRQLRSWIFALGVVLSVAGLSPACDGNEADDDDGDSVAFPEDSDQQPGDDTDRGTDDTTEQSGDTEEPGEDTEEPGDGTEDEDTNGTVACEAKELPGLTATNIVGDGTFQEPVYVTQPPGESEDLYVVEQTGRILRVTDGEVKETPFLDIRNRVDYGGERGLLGLAFHPDYQDNGRFFINYTPSGGPPLNVVAEYERSSDDPHEANPDEVRRLIEQNDPESNHNGGMVAFDSDGYLYVAMGDGGGGCDEHGSIGNGQNPNTLLGALLRLDVDAPGRNFAPQDNPFVGSEEGDDRIWAWGLRNPWRFSFDSETDDLWIGDVGQKRYEEINFEPASSDGGENYGWRVYEAKHKSTVAPSNCDLGPGESVDDHHEPILEIDQDDGSQPVGRASSITGGYVYRGSAIPDMRGYYLYGDYGTDKVAALRYCDGEIVDHVELEGLSGAGDGLASFGEDNAGHLYLVYVRSGEVLRIEKQ